MIPISIRGVCNNDKQCGVSHVAGNDMTVGFRVLNVSHLAELMTNCFRFVMIVGFRVNLCIFGELMVILSDWQWKRDRSRAVRRQFRITREIDSRWCSPIKSTVLLPHHHLWDEPHNETMPPISDKTTARIQRVDRPQRHLSVPPRDFSRPNQDAAPPVQLPWLEEDRWEEEEDTEGQEHRGLHLDILDHMWVVPRFVSSL